MPTALEAAIAELDAALEGTEIERPWRVARRHARRTRRVSATLPRLLGIAQHVTIALARVDELFPVLPVELYERARIVRDHLVAMRDVLRTGREDDELDLEDP